MTLACNTHAHVHIYTGEYWLLCSQQLQSNINTAHIFVTLFLEIYFNGYHFTTQSHPCIFQAVSAAAPLNSAF